MTIRVTCWNVKEFGKKPKSSAALKKRVRSVAAQIKSQKPDIFGILEVETLDILELIDTEFPEFDFGFTEGHDGSGKASKEILVGWRRGQMDQVTFSQKRQFNLYNPYLRPGALLSFKTSGTWYNILFLHTDSGTEARDFGNRYEMFDKVWNLRKSLDKKVGNKRERLLVIGDLNTMGLQFPTQRKSDLIVPGGSEITALSDFAIKNDMKLLSKSHDVTWKKMGRNFTSDLDHAMASNLMTFTPLGPNGSGENYSVQVSGWVDKPDDEREAFLRDLSDHCLLTVEIEA